MHLVACRTINWLLFFFVKGDIYYKISLGLSNGRNLFCGLGLARVVDLVFGFGFGFGFGFAPMPLALLWQSLGCGLAAVLALAE